MQIAPLVSQHVAEVVHGNWTDIYLDDVTANVTFEEAVALPPGLTNSIAMLVKHIGFYNWVVMERLKGSDPVIDDSNGFTVTINNNEDWQQVRRDALYSFAKLAEMVKGLPDEKLQGLTPAGNSTFYKTLHGIAEHAPYHLGQIVLIKKLLRANK